MPENDNKKIRNLRLTVNLQDSAANEAATEMYDAQFVNNFSTKLAADISAADTNFSLSPTPVPLVQLSPDTYFYIVMTIQGGTGAYEIIWCTAWTIDSSGKINITARRGMEGTKAQAWAAGTGIEARLTKKHLDNIVSTILNDCGWVGGENTWTENNTFTKNFVASGPSKFSATATFGAPVACTGSLTVSGVANFGEVHTQSLTARGVSVFMDRADCMGSLNVDGDSNFGHANFSSDVNSKGVGYFHLTQISATAANDWVQYNIYSPDGNQRQGGLQWLSANGKAHQICHKDGSNAVVFWFDGTGDVFWIQTDGNFYSRYLQSIFGGSGFLGDIKNYIDNRVNSNRGIRTGGGFWSGATQNISGTTDNVWGSSGQYICGVRVKMVYAGTFLQAVFVGQMQHIIDGNWVNVWGY